MQSQNLPVAIIGAGPVGLAAAAHLLERGETPLVIEAGQSVGQNMMSWAHVRMFSPWEFTVDAAMVRLLEQSGWQMPPLGDLPTGGDLVTQFLRPFAALPIVKDHIRLDSRVVAISRRYVDKMKDARRDDAPFVIHIENSAGQSEIIEARAVIDASGTWHNPNPIGAHGLFAVGERQNADHIAYGIPDILGQDTARYRNQRVLVVGSGHSAINAVLELGKLRTDYPDTKIYWAMRGTRLQQVYGGETDDQLPARGALGTRVRALVEDGIVTILSPFYLKQIVNEHTGVRVIGDCDNHEQSVLVDEIIATTGARPDLGMLRELRLNLDATLETTPILAPMIDPNIHSCGTVPPHGEAELRHPEKDFYMVGMKSYGRAPSFLLATGYEQARSVVAYLVGDYEAAREVQLNLPQTGVCSTDFADDEGAACCGTSAPVNIEIASVRLGDIAIGGSPAPQTVIATKPSSCC
ncbi:MAG: FAD-dependent oxidoreductase [Phototrophicaceae bacterium]